ncbi:MAG: c-type cytochrome, partial [Verrucomicrobiota bacterium]
STDNWFRPTTLKIGPDGALYIADMYRLILEHPEYFPAELKNRPDIRVGDDKGRIYRVYPENAPLRKIPRLDKLNTPELIAALDSPNGWQRDTIQRLLVQSRDKAAITPLQQILSHSENPKARLQALSILSGLDALTEKDLLTALNDSHFAARRLAIQFAESFFGKSPELDAKVMTMVDDGDIRVRYQLAFSLGESSDAAAARALSKLALKDWTNSPMQIAVMSSATHHVDEMLRSVFANSKTTTPSPKLIEQLVFLATALSHDGILAETISHLGTPVNGTRLSQWQIWGTLGFLDALDHRKLSLAQFQEQADFKLKSSIAQLDAIFVQARETADNSSAAEGDRLLAVRLLGCRTNENDLEHLGKLLGPQNSPALQHAALQSIVIGGREGAVEILMANWKTCALSLRQEILNSLLGRSEWSESLLTGIETGTIATGDISIAQRQKLLSHSKAEIHKRAEKIFAVVNSDRAKIIENYKSVAELRGNVAKGHALFLQTCATCHQLNGEGSHVGPDLGTMADKSVQSLLVGILDPNQAVDPAFAASTIITKDDRELSGVIASETSTSISLKIPGGSEELILRNNIKESNHLSHSLMPEGFETALKPQEMADLISYILNTHLKP